MGVRRPYRVKANTCSWEPEDLEFILAFLLVSHVSDVSFLQIGGIGQYDSRDVLQ